ncbi:ipa protein [Staphylotrichum tortipilum]|uniref:Ipa protein n=1 Tax=Staphylotrichum tortipilum TaxID=2831512 RepID=A0AAN6ME26_9PEZI|nr:ipa protein [Staphylotrichum longicolle]
MGEPASSNAGLAKELHADLVRKYKKHETAIETAWRSFDTAQREACLRAGTLDGAVLQHPTDRALGNVYKFIPECNLRDIAKSGPDFLLDLLRHRATTSLFQQYCEGDGGGAGDHGFIAEMERTRGLRHIQNRGNSFTLFLDENQYGESYTIHGPMEGSLGPLMPAVHAGLCVPWSRGELILLRQIYLMQCLVILIDDILAEGSRTRDDTKMPKKSDKAAAAALAKLTIQDRPPPEHSLPDLIATAREQKATLDEYFGLLCAEPVVLAHAVNLWFFTRPEQVADEKGTRLPAFTDRYISGAVLEAINSSVQAAAVWDYICRLLELLESQAADEIYRAITLQEIANVCHLEFERAQALFKRFVQTGTGAKFFRRQAGAYDRAGNARVDMNCNLKKLAKADPQLYYMMRLCQPETTPGDATDWLKKLAEFNESHPAVRDRIEEREVGALNDLIVVVSFVQDLAPAISMPSLSRKKGQMFVSRLQDLEAELVGLKDQIDLLDFALPIDNLLEPRMADGALKKLDQFVIDKVGTKMGFLYEDLVHDCFAALEIQYQLVKAKMEEQAKAKMETQKKAKIAQQQAMDWTPIPVPAPQPQEERIVQRKQKEKTRPAHSSVYDITTTRAKLPTAAAAADEPAPRLKVSASTAAVFATLFDKTQSRRAVDWADFAAAMAALGFAVVPKFGSVYTFLPPASMGASRSITVHRPHRSRIEGYQLLILSRRLRRAFGWGEGSFEVD